MPDLPSSLALTVIPDGSSRTAAPVRNNFTAGQTATNGLITALSGGTAGQVLTASDTDTVAWATPATPPGTRLAYVEFSATTSTTTATEAAPLDVVSSGSITFDGTAVIVEFFAPIISCNNTSLGGISLWEDAADLGRLWDNNNVATEFGGPFQRQLTPAAGAHTFKVRVWTAGGMTAQASSGAGGAGTRLPGFIRITKA